MKSKIYNSHLITIVLFIIIVLIIPACDKAEVQTNSQTGKYQRELKYASSITMVNGIYKIDTNIIFANRNRKELVRALVSEVLIEKKVVADIPDFIKTFLAAVSKEKEFIMANPGEKYQEGWFDLGKGVPTSQLICFSMGKSIALFSYYSGGIRRRQNLAVIKFEGSSVVDFWFDNYDLNIKTKEEIIEYFKTNRTRNGNC